MKSPSCDITLHKAHHSPDIHNRPPTYTAISSTARIFAAITLAIPTGDTHMIAKTILMITWVTSDKKEPPHLEYIHLINGSKNADKLFAGIAEGS